MGEPSLHASDCRTWRSRSCHGCVTGIVAVVIGSERFPVGASIEFGGQEFDPAALEKLALVGLEKAAFAAPASLSWGQQKLVGLARALEIAAFDNPISAEQALEWGLVNQVVPDGELMEASLTVARTVRSPSARSPISSSKRAGR